MIYRGTVQEGERRGSALGFPTANVSFEGPESGIYAARVVFDDLEYHAAVYADQKRKLLEAHLGNFSGGDLYGKEMEIELMQKIRDDKKFDDPEELKQAIAADVEAVRNYFSS